MGRDGVGQHGSWEQRGLPFITRIREGTERVPRALAAGVVAAAVLAVTAMIPEAGRLATRPVPTAPIGVPPVTPLPVASASPVDEGPRIAATTYTDDRGRWILAVLDENAHARTCSRSEASSLRITSITEGRILYVEGDQDVFQLPIECDADRQHVASVSRITETIGNSLTCAAWSPSRRSLAIGATGERPGTWVGTPDGDWRRISIFASCDWIDESRIAVRTPTNVMSVDIDTEEMSFIPYPAMYDGSPSPDRFYTIKRSTRGEGAPELVSRLGDPMPITRGSVRLPDEGFDHGGVFRYADPWSPDGRYFVGSLESGDVVIYSPGAGHDLVDREFRSPNRTPVRPDQVVVGWLGDRTWYATDAGAWLFDAYGVSTPVQLPDDGKMVVPPIHNDRPALRASPMEPPKMTDVQVDGGLTAVVPPGWQRDWCRCVIGTYRSDVALSGLRSQHAAHFGSDAPILIAATSDAVDEAIERIVEETGAQARPNPNNEHTTTYGTRAVAFGANRFTRLLIRYYEGADEIYLRRWRGTTYLVQVAPGLVELDPSIRSVMRSLRFR